MCLPRCALSTFSEEEKICFFKVFPCGREYNHDFAACFYSHPGEKAKRRCLLEHMYGGKLCPDLKQNGDCPRGDACHMTHSMFEYYMHPLRYRTKMCKDGTSCNRPFCFFAHQPSELRQPVEAGTFLASLSPQALASTAERLISGSTNSSGRSGAGSSSSTEAPNSPSSRVQVVYHAPLPAAFQQQQQQQQQQQAPMSTATGIMSGNPLLPVIASGIHANHGSSTIRLPNSPPSGMSSSSSNVEGMFLLHAGGVPVSTGVSCDLPSPIANRLYQPPAATVAPEVLLSPPRPVMPAVSTGGLIMAATGGLYPSSQQQWQQQTFAENPAMLAGMISQLALTEAPAPAAPEALAVPPASGSAAAVAALSAAAARRSLDEAIFRKQQQQQLLSKACLMSNNINSMLHQQQQQQLDQQRLAMDGVVNLASTAAGITCLPPAALDMSIPVTGPVGGGGGALGSLRYESRFEAPLFSGVQW